MSELTAEQKLDIVMELIESLEQDDIKQSIRNATSCIQSGDTLQLENIVKNHNYRAGKNQMINDIREAIGLEILWLPGEKEKMDRSIKLSQMGTQHMYDCPPLLDEIFEINGDGGVRLMPLGYDGDTLLVIGTTSLPRAKSLIHQYQDQYLSLDRSEFAKDEDIQRRKVVWRKSYDEMESGEFTHMFRWDNKSTKNNPGAIPCFIVET